jgi:nicotinate-nucleotide adenylyltransferase
VGKGWGVFGGTFDPPHIGHFILAAEACQQLDLDRVLWVLTPEPPHKQGRRISTIADRLAMLETALAEAAQLGEIAFELCRVDIDRPPPHYAVDTMQLLHQQNPGAALIYLMGGDSLAHLPTWHTPQAFVAACNEIGVMLRPGRSFDLDALEAALPGLKARLRFIRAPLLEIASSDLRRRIAEGQSCRYYLLPGVQQVIQVRGLYQSSATG